MEALVTEWFRFSPDMDGEMEEHATGEWVYFLDVKDKVDTLQARIDKLEKDAARYQWLRKGLGFQMQVPNGVSDTGKQRYINYTFANKTETDYAVTLDATIDAAINLKENI